MVEIFVLLSLHSLARFDMQMLDIQFQFKRFPIYRKESYQQDYRRVGGEMKLIKINEFSPLISLKNNLELPRRNKRIESKQAKE